MTKHTRPGLDLREPEVRRTIETIRAMGLDCSRTNRGGEYRIEKRIGDLAIVKYAKTSTEAIAVARSMQNTTR